VGIQSGDVGNLHNFLNFSRYKSKYRAVQIPAITLLLISIVACPVLSSAQSDPPTIPLEKFYVDRKNRPRGIFKNFKFSASTGLGKTYFKHKLDGFGIYQSAAVGPYIFAGTTTPTAGHSQWIDTNIPVTPINVAGGDFLVTSDTAKIGFKSKSFTIPLKLSIHYEFKNIRVGVGFDRDLIFLKPFKPISYTDNIRTVETGPGTVSATKFFGLVGYSFYRIDKYLFTGDLQFGTNKFGKNFNRAVIKPSPFFNIGITVERELSEYLKLFVRPNFEIKSYTLSLAESNLSIKHKANSFVWNVGFTYSIPELPKCKIKDCRIQINHAHGDREYRSRAHPIYKKQNPAYGENDPKLIKYRWRNRKKINPY
jgi:hypothetical protein